MPRIPILFLSASTGCVAQVDLPLPPLDGYATQIVLEDCNEHVSARIYATQGLQSIGALASSCTEVQLWLLQYKESLDELNLVEGTLPRANQPCVDQEHACPRIRCTKLPEPARSFTAIWSDEEHVPFGETKLLDEVLSFEFMEPPVEHCVCDTIEVAEIEVTASTLQVVAVDDRSALVIAHDEATGLEAFLVDDTARTSPVSGDLFMPTVSARAPNGSLWFGDFDGALVPAQLETHSSSTSLAYETAITGTTTELIQGLALYRQAPVEIFTVTTSGLIERYDGVERQMISPTPPPAQSKQNNSAVWIAPGKAILSQDDQKDLVYYDYASQLRRHLWPTELEHVRQLTYLPGFGPIATTNLGSVFIYTCAPRLDPTCWKPIPISPSHDRIDSHASIPMGDGILVLGNGGSYMLITPDGVCDPDVIEGTQHLNLQAGAAIEGGAIVLAKVPTSAPEGVKARAFVVSLRN